MSELGRALVQQLDDEDLALLAKRLAIRGDGDAGGWLGAKDAAAYAGCSVPALRHAMKSGQLTYEQAVPGGKVWFTRDALDGWRRAVGLR